jgi:hypothetical protein
VDRQRIPGRKQMVKLVELISYTSSCLGVLFIILAVVSKLYTIPTLGTSPSYPYQFLSIPYFFLGLSFLIVGIAGIWVNYFKYQRTRKIEKPVLSYYSNPESKPIQLQNPPPPPPEVVQTRIQEPNIVPIHKNNEERNPNRSNFIYLLFAFGALLLIVGVYLSTYTTVEMVNQPMTMYGVTINIPHAVQIYPYSSIGIISIVFSFVLILVAFMGYKR